MILGVCGPILVSTLVIIHTKYDTTLTKSVCSRQLSFLSSVCQDSGPTNIKLYWYGLMLSAGYTSQLIVHAGPTMQFDYQASHTCITITKPHCTYVTITKLHYASLHLAITATRGPQRCCQFYNMLICTCCVPNVVTLCSHFSKQTGTGSRMRVVHRTYVMTMNEKLGRSMEI